MRDIPHFSFKYILIPAVIKVSLLENVIALESLILHERKR